MVTIICLQVYIICLRFLIEIIALIYVYFKVINKKQMYKIEINYLRMTVKK
jgi:hypothetical protein